MPQYDRYHQMDKLDIYRNIIEKIIDRHAQYKPSQGQIETIPICDTVQDNYLLIDVGWDRTGRVHAVFLHLRIRDGKIWLEWDGAEQGVTVELIDLEVSSKDIVLGFYRPQIQV